MNIRRAIVIVLDGVGVGAAPDAADYGDVGSNSMGNTARAVGGLNLPNMGQLGLGYITEIDGVPPVANPTGAYGKMQPKAAGKDSISGHWEMMGVALTDPFPTYPNGFPDDVMTAFTEKTGYGYLGNVAASGTEIIKQLGEQHMATGRLIVYTSADSVFQIAAHEEIVPVDELYRVCQVTRDILQGDHAVGRVIARPFVGINADDFTRTSRRKDFPRTPPTDTVLDVLSAAGKTVYAIGKIDELFGGRGITKSNHKVSNAENIESMLGALQEVFEGLLFVNLVEFDMIYGHRNNPRGYADALEGFDEALAQIQALMREDDIGIIVADHGVDPTTDSTDHSREYVPLLVFGKQVTPVDLGVRTGYGDVAATLLTLFGLPDAISSGTGFLDDIRP